MSRTQTSWFVLHLPELGKAFENFYHKCNENGVLDKKTKELLMVALTSVFRAPSQTEEHLKRALEAGATKEEISEVLLIAAAAFLVAEYTQDSLVDSSARLLLGTSMDREPGTYWSGLIDDIRIYNRAVHP